MKPLLVVSLSLLLCYETCSDAYAQPPQSNRPPRLLDDLTPPQNSRRGRGGGRRGRDNNRLPLPEVGQQFPELTAHAEDGTEVQLPTATKGSYAVLVRGCLTCPVFWRSYHEVEAISRDYAPLGVKFYFVYGSLAHPENNGYVQPFSLDERLMHVKEAKQTLKTTIPWLADNMDNEIKAAMGSMPNSEVLLDPQGKITYIQSWSNASQLRKALEQQFGTAKGRTNAADLGLPVIRRQRPTEEVVPRVEVASQLTAVIVKPAVSAEPHYAKLRVEVESSVLESGSGQVYLGYHLDPLYHTHWNNLADPLRFELKGPQGATLTPTTGSAPEVEELADTGPREFLIDVKDVAKGAKLEVTAYYYACSHDPDFCKAITQRYEIELVRDPFGGGVSGRSFRFGGGVARGRRGGR